MAELIPNPRRSPRAPVRCEARIALKEGGYWAGPTTDYGPRGCQLVAPMRLEPGSRIFLELVNDRVPEPCALSGRIAWCTGQSPWHFGIAFDDGASITATAFFDRLAQAYPGLDTYGRAPDEIPAEAPLAPRSPPPVDLRLIKQEVQVMRVVGPGMTAAELRNRLGADWDWGVNALFSLIGHGHLVLGAPDPAAAAAWDPVLARSERA